MEPRERRALLELKVSEGLWVFQVCRESRGSSDPPVHRVKPVKRGPSGRLDFLERSARREVTERTGSQETKEPTGKQENKDQWAPLVLQASMGT